MKYKIVLKQAWSTLGTANGVYIYTFACNIILARLLLPEDFGLLAVVIALVGLMEIVTSFSLNILFIQRRDHPSLLRSIFQIGILIIGLKLAVGLVVYIIFRQQYDDLIWNLFFLVLLSKLFGGLAPLILARLDKRGEFLKSIFVSAGSNAVAVTASVIAVFLGAGVYGLSCRVIAPPILTFGVMAFAYPSLFPANLLKFNRRQLRFVLRISTNLYFQKASELAYDRIPSLIIESLFGPAVLGLLYQSTYLVRLVQRMISPINNQVALVFFASNRLDAEESSYGYRHLFLLNVIFALPVVCLFWKFSEDIVVFLWGNKWRDVAALLSIMSPLAILLPIFALLKSRLLGLRANVSITTVYCIGLISFILGLFYIPLGLTTSEWIAGLSLGSIALMVIALQFCLWQKRRAV